MAIYFKGAEDAKNIKELLSKGFNYYFVETFSDKECKERQCHEARRSFPDILEICQTYFPETTEKELAKLLLQDLKLVCFYCSNIKKYVFLEKHSNMTYNFDHRDGFPSNGTDSQGNSIEKFKKLCE